MTDKKNPTYWPYKYFLCFRKHH